MIIVEVLGRGGRVAERVKLASLPATIGRGYGSDVVLDDRYVDAAHARLLADDAGRLVVEDLGSVNGVSASEYGAREARLVVAPGATFIVGRTALRVVTSELAVAPALRDPDQGSRLVRVLHGRAAAVALTVIVAPLLGLSLYLGQTDKSGGAEFALDTLGALAAVIAWAGAWAMATRIRTGAPRFLAHVAVAWLVFAASLAIALAADWLRFLAGGTSLADAGLVIATVVTVTVVLYGHLGITTQLSALKRVLSGLGLSALLLGLGAVAALGVKEQQHNEIAVDMPLKPLPASLIPAETPDAFLARAAKLQRAVDDDALEK